MVTLGNAAKQLNISKPTISKAIAKGHLSATRREDGSFAIDPSELMRWWETVRHRFQVQAGTDLQRATHSDNSGNAEGGGNGSGGNTVSVADTELRVSMARLEGEIAGLKELVRTHRDQIDDLRGERDKLLAQVDTAQRLLTHQTSEATAARTSKLFDWFRRAS